MWYIRANLKCSLLCLWKRKDKVPAPYTRRPGTAEMKRSPGAVISAIWTAEDLRGPSYQTILQFCELRGPSTAHPVSGAIKPPRAQSWILIWGSRRVHEIWVETASQQPAQGKVKYKKLWPRHSPARGSVRPGRVCEGGRKEGLEDMSRVLSS